MVAVAVVTDVLRQHLHTSTYIIHKYIYIQIINIRNTFSTTSISNTNRENIAFGQCNQHIIQTKARIRKKINIHHGMKTTNNVMIAYHQVLYQK